MPYLLKVIDSIQYLKALEVSEMRSLKSNHVFLISFGEQNLILFYKTGTISLNNRYLSKSIEYSRKISTFHTQFSSLVDYIKSFYRKGQFLVRSISIQIFTIFLVIL